MTKEELEKEAEEYADWFWGASPSVVKALARAYIKGAEPREKRIAELKAQLESERDLPAIAYMQGAESYKRKADKQLTKAKEILKAVVDFYPTMTATILLEAEQFLNSEVEK